jgi:glycosyltransferase involved in cell wall biosynthesis
MLSILIPAYNEAQNIENSVREITQQIEKTRFADDFEIIMVDDHSTDHTYEIAASLKGLHVRCLRLSKNSGSHTAIRMGLRFVQGEAAIVISADGQDNPVGIHDLIKKWDQGSQIVWALRKSRKNESFFKKLPAIIFYKILALLTKSRKSHIDLSRADFYLLDQKVIQAINLCEERNTSLFGLIFWQGFRQDFIEYDRNERTASKSKWNLSKRIGLAKDWIIAFSGIPLRIMSYVGTIVALIGFLFAIFTFIRATKGSPIPGWSSLMVVLLLLGGFQMIMFGVIGEYLWRNLEESRKRPLAFIEKSTFENDETDPAS